MSIQKQLRADMISAMKSKDSEKLDYIRFVIGEFNKVGKEVDDTKAISILKGLKKGAKEMKNKFEIKILDSYLPQMLDEKDVNLIITDIIESIGWSDNLNIGKVMGEIKKHPNSAQIDGKLASSIVRQKLAK